MNLAFATRLCQVLVDFSYNHATGNAKSLEVKEKRELYYNEIILFQTQ